MENRFKNITEYLRSKGVTQFICESNNLGDELQFSFGGRKHKINFTKWNKKYQYNLYSTDEEQYIIDIFKNIFHN